MEHELKKLGYEGEFTSQAMGEAIETLSTDLDTRKKIHMLAMYKAGLESGLSLQTVCAFVLRQLLKNERNRTDTVCF